MKLKTLSFILSILLFSTSQAGTPPFQGCSSLGCIGKPDTIYLNPNGTVQVPPPAGANASNLNCSLGDGAYLTLKRDHIHFKELYSMLLTAQTAQKDIYLRTITNSSDCEIWYSVLY